MTVAEHARTGSATRGGHARSTWIGLLRSGGTRMAILPVSAVLGIVTTRLVIERYGEGAYAQYGLLVGIGSLLPWADLGVSAAVLNAIGSSDDPRHDEYVRRVLVTCTRVLCGSMVVLVALALTITVLGLWPAIFGAGLDRQGGPVAAGICLALIGVAMPLGIGQRVLSGLGKNHVSIALLGLQAPITLGVVVLLVQQDVAAGSYIAVIPYAASVLIALLALVFASRLLRPVLAEAMRAAFRRGEQGAAVFNTAWPMLMQMIALPIAMQTDRLLLSHLSGTTALAEYNLATQIYSPVWAVVSAAGFTLWPVFARDRARGASTSPAPISLVFGGTALAVCLALAAASGLLSDLATGGRIQLSAGLLASYTVLMVGQGLKYPLGMYLTDPGGLRFQAVMIGLLLPVNLGLSWVLAASIGAAGPVLGSAVGVLLFQVLANAWYVRRLRRRAAEAGAPPSGLARAFSSIEDSS